MHNERLTAGNKLDSARSSDDSRSSMDTRSSLTKPKMKDRTCHTTRKNERESIRRRDRCYGEARDIVDNCSRRSSAGSHITSDTSQGRRKPIHAVPQILGTKMVSRSGMDSVRTGLGCLFRRLAVLSEMQVPGLSQLQHHKGL